MISDVKGFFSRKFKESLLTRKINYHKNNDYERVRKRWEYKLVRKPRIDERKRVEWLKTNGLLNIKLEVKNGNKEKHR